MVRKKLTLNPFMDIQSTWKYECVLTKGDKFPFASGNAHGGELTIRCIKKNENGFSIAKIIVTGVRNWTGLKQGRKYKFTTQINKPIKWRSIEGSILSNNRIFYKYNINREKMDGKPVTGITFLQLNYDKKGNLKPRGDFFYFPNSESRSKSPISNVNSDKEREMFSKIYGTVIFTKKRK